MNKILFAVGFCVLVGLGCSNAKDKAKIDTHFQLGLSSLQEGDSTGALRHLLAAEQLDPEDPEIQNALGLIYIDKERYEKSVEHFQRAIALKPQYPEAYNNLCVAYLRLSRWEKAIEACRTAADDLLYATPERAWLNTGWAYYNLGDYNTAINYYRRALQKLPNWCMARYNLALAYFRLSQFAEAVENLETAVEKCPVYINAYEALGDVYQRKGQLRDAKQYYQKCQSIDPQSDIGRNCKLKANLIP